MRSSIPTDGLIQALVFPGIVSVSWCWLLSLRSCNAWGRSARRSTNYYEHDPNRNLAPEVDANRYIFIHAEFFGIVDHAYDCAPGGVRHHKVSRPKLNYPA